MGCPIRDWVSGAAELNLGFVLRFINRLSPFSTCSINGPQSTKPSIKPKLCESSKKTLILLIVPIPTGWLSASGHSTIHTSPDAGLILAYFTGKINTLGRSPWIFCFHFVLFFCSHILCFPIFFSTRSCYVNPEKPLFCRPLLSFCKKNRLFSAKFFLKFY